MDTHLGHHTPVRPAPDPSRIARHLRANRVRITDAWRAAVRAESLPNGGTSDPALANILPGLLDRLEALLDDGGLVTRVLIDRELGFDFFDVRTDRVTSVTELLREYHALTRVILAELSAKPGTTRAARDSVLTYLQRAAYLHVERTGGADARDTVQIAKHPARGARAWSGWFALAGSVIASHVYFNHVLYRAGDAPWYAAYARGAVFAGAGALILWLRRSVARAEARARTERERSLTFAGLQKALADVGQLGVRQTEVVSLLHLSAARISEGLGASVVKILEYEPLRGVFLIRATSGLDGVVLEDQVTTTDDPQAFFTLNDAEPVTVESFADEARFALPPCLRARGIRSSVSVAIPGQYAPFGVLLVYATSARTFTRDEKSFALTVAGTLANAIERRRGEARLRDLNAELGRSNAELNRFAAIAAHDLKAPLNSVSQFAELIEASASASLPPHAVGYFKIISRATERMRDLVDRLLTYSRVGAHDAPVARVDVAAVCAAVVQDLRSSIEAAGALVTCGKLPELIGDEVELRQLFQNLISNAIKFVGTSRPEVHVGCDADPDGKGWRFVVADNGIGIDPTEAAGIFEPFRRLRASAYEGSGLGLAICLRIVERHGGRIWMESRPGVGSSFYFTLPRESFRAD